jgi:hypothetical protein
MSETKKNPPHPPQGNPATAAASAAREGVREVRPAARETLDRTEELGHRFAEGTRDIGDAMTDAAVRTAGVASEMGQRAAEQGRDVMLLGLRSAAGMNGRFADVSYGRSHHLLGATARALDIYREAGEHTAENVQALITSSISLGRGIQQMQHAYVDLWGRAMERAKRKPQDVLHAKTLEELAEVQRDLYLDAVNYALEASTTLLQLTARVTQDAMRPLQGRVNESAR